MEAAKQLASALANAANTDLGPGERSSSFEFAGYGDVLSGRGLIAFGAGFGMTGRIGFFHADRGGELTLGGTAMGGVSAGFLAALVAAGSDMDTSGQTMMVADDSTTGLSAAADIAYVYYYHSFGVGLGARASYASMSNSMQGIDTSTEGLSAGVVVSVYAARDLEKEVQLRFHDYPATTAGTSSDTGLEACFGVNGFSLSLGANQLIDGTTAFYLSVGLRDATRQATVDIQ
jgi:hypothetical protein